MPVAQVPVKNRTIVSFPFATPKNPTFMSGAVGDKSTPVTSANWLA
jgi:hypothetical protein